MEENYAESGLERVGQFGTRFEYTRAVFACWLATNIPNGLPDLRLVVGV